MTTATKTKDTTTTTNNKTEYVLFQGQLIRIPDNVNRFEFLKELRESMR